MIYRLFKKEKEKANDILINTYKNCQKKKKLF
jgi:hypothetical protein